jgi:hypothetical protein
MLSSHISTIQITRQSDYMTTRRIQPADLILVAYIPTPRDLEIARVLGWYRIPLRTAPKVVSVDHMAFYQPSSFGDHKWHIEWIAPVRGHELVTRAELLQGERDHPKAGEEYFKIQLGTLEKLPHPIMAEKWKRITFFYTTGDYLLGAETINDLVVHSDERKLLWQSLRERAEQGQDYEIPEADIPLEVIAALLGIKEMVANYDTDG